MENNIEGIYAAYLSAKMGEGLGIIMIKDGLITGCDVGGVRFDGYYQGNPTKNAWIGKIKVTAPPNVQVIQGFQTGEAGMTYEVDCLLPSGFQDLPYLTIGTPLGAVNVILELLRRF